MKQNRRSFIKHSLLLGAGWIAGAKIASDLPSMIFRPYPEINEVDFVAPLLDSLHHDRIAILGVDFTGSHTAAHMITDYLYVNGAACQLFSNLQSQSSLQGSNHHNSIFLETFRPKLKTQKPGEKFIVSVRMRQRKIDELLNVLLKNQFKVFIFNVPSISHAAMNSLIFKNLKVGSLLNREFNPDIIPVVKGFPNHLREFETELDLLQTAKSIYPNSTILTFNEAAYQNFVRMRLKSFPTWREPYLLNPDAKLLNPELVLKHKFSIA